jgi:hypothetical protein
MRNDQRTSNDPYSSRTIDVARITQQHWRRCQLCKESILTNEALGCHSISNIRCFSFHIT